MPYRRVFPQRASTRQGTVYLLHFEAPFKHAQHYIGFSQAITDRLVEQLRGGGAKLVQHVIAAGIPIVLAKEWENVPQTFEYQLKNRGGARRICPVCSRRRACSVQ
jgi:hypothetical protein